MLLTTILNILISRVALGQAAAVSSPQTTRVSCNNISIPEIPGATIVSIVAEKLLNGSGVYVDEVTPAIGHLDGVNVCDVKVAVSHPGISENVGFQFYLPLEGWNNRFLGVGGGGYVAGNSGILGLGEMAKKGFITAMTDGGNISDAQGLLRDDMITADGGIDMSRLENFASRSLHELAVVGKLVSESFYGKAPAHSYWKGCSTGGRQGMMLAQKYPGDFDGILANAPALDFPRTLVALGWAEFTMRRLNHEVSACALNGFQAGAVAACDKLDGVEDGVIANPDMCRFDPFSVVGQIVDCKDSPHTITSQDAEVVKVIMAGAKGPEGEQLWEPYSWGMTYGSVHPDDPNFAMLWDKWTTIMINKDPSFDISGYKTLTQFAHFMQISLQEFSDVIGTTQTDLSAFRDQGGKLLSWHGLADDILPKEISVQYRKAVEKRMGGSKAVDEFYRLFLPPGLSHCYLGKGAYPADALDSLIKWVEKGEAPEELHGTMKALTGEKAERIICSYPLVARYDGKGDDKKASSYTCAKSFCSTR
ncbi:feruloyl esterase B [Sarocladium strictum]